MAIDTGLKWEARDLLEVISQSDIWLRKAMRYSDKRCEVKKWVDAKLLEMLWCPFSNDHDPKWLSKDVIRSELDSLSTEALWTNCCEWNYNDECPRCHAGGLLARVLLGPMDWLFKCENENRNGAPAQSTLLWVVAKLYDQLGGTNFYRTLSDMARDTPDYLTGQLLLRIPEADYVWFKEWIADFSTLLRDAENITEVDYCLVLSKEHWKKIEKIEKIEVHPPPQIKHYDVSSIMSALESVNIPSLRSELSSINSLYVSELLSRRIMSKSTGDHREEALQRQKQGAGEVHSMLNSKGVKQAFNWNDLEAAIKSTKIVLEACFYRDPKSESEKGMPIPKDLEIALKELINSVKKKSNVDLKREVDLWKLANYFIWLKALHPDVVSYTVRYAANYRLLPDSDPVYEGVRDRIQNACFVIASRELPSPKLLAAARVSLTHCLGPLEDYYAITQARKSSAVMARADVGTGMFHNLRQYLHSLQKYSGALYFIADRDKNSADIALVAEKLSNNLDIVFRFQNAVFEVLTIDPDKGRIDKSLLGKEVSVKDKVASALKLLYEGVMGALTLAAYHKSDLIGQNDFNAARAISGCIFPGFEARGDRVEKHKRELAEKASIIVKAPSFNSYKTDTLDDISATFAALKVTINTSEICDDERLPENLFYLALNEMLLNSIRAALWFSWAGQGQAVINIKTKMKRLVVVNTAIVEDIKNAMIEPRRPLGKSSGWGRWATQEMIRLTGWKLLHKQTEIGHATALSTTLTSMEDHEHV